MLVKAPEENRGLELFEGAFVPDRGSDSRDDPDRRPRELVDEATEFARCTVTADPSKGMSTVSVLEPVVCCRRWNIRRIAAISRALALEAGNCLGS
jgi:hypothetical protein